MFWRLEDWNQAIGRVGFFCVLCGKVVIQASLLGLFAWLTSCSHDSFSVGISISKFPMLIMNTCQTELGSTLFAVFYLYYLCKTSFPNKITPWNLRLELQFMNLGITTQPITRVYVLRILIDRTLAIYFVCLFGLVKLKSEPRFLKCFSESKCQSSELTF